MLYLRGRGRVRREGGGACVAVEGDRSLAAILPATAAHIANSQSVLPGIWRKTASSVFSAIPIKSNSPGFFHRS